MDFRLADQQSEVLDAVNTLLERHAGPERMRALGGDNPRYDWELDRELRSAGFTTIGREPDAGPLEAALVVEAAATKLAVIAVGAEALVLPGLTDQAVDVAVFLTTRDHEGLVRYAADAPAMLVLVPEEDEALLVRAPPNCQRVVSRFGYPMGRVTKFEAKGETFGPGSGRRMLAWWQAALAVELVGTMRAALASTVAYATDRVQFGRPIGSFQAVQHRLAESTVLSEGARWLALEAVWLGAPPEAAAAAIVHAVEAARRVMLEAHQITGAVGFTIDYGLHLWTMRLAALVVEAGWVSPAGGDLVTARWGPGVGQGNPIGGHT